MNSLAQPRRVQPVHLSSKVSTFHPEFARLRHLFAFKTCNSLCNRDGVPLTSFPPPQLRPPRTSYGAHNSHILAQSGGDGDRYRGHLSVTKCSKLSSAQARRDVDSRRSRLESCFIDMTGVLDTFQFEI